MPLKRRWGRVAVGLAAAIVGMWAFAALYISAGAQDEVLVVREGVDRYDLLSEDDFDVVRASLEPAAEGIPASDVDELVEEERRAATDLVPGSILVEDHVMDEGAPVVGDGEEAVPARLGENEFPATDSVEVGQAVRVVLRPELGQSGEVNQTSHEGWLLHIGSTDEHSRERSVAVVVSTANAEQVSAAAADDLLSITLQGG